MRKLKLRTSSQSALIYSDDRQNQNLAMFVHGMFQSNLKAWGRLSELLIDTADDDKVFAKWDFLFIGYAWNKVQTFLEIAEKIGGSWDYARSGRLVPGTQYCRFALIGYSLGTLGIRQLVVTPGKYATGGGLSEIGACYLFGSPTYGSRFAGIPLFKISRALNFESPAIQSLWQATADAFQSASVWPTVQLVAGEDDKIASSNKMALLTKFPGDKPNVRWLNSGHSGMIDIRNLEDAVVDELRAALI